jgi:general stress protein 26
MRNINADIKAFLEKHRLCVLAVDTGDGNIHAATLHCSYTDEPLKFFFSTDKGSRKCIGLISGRPRKASMVIGFQEKEWVTFQADGTVVMVQDKEHIKSIREVHYKKFPESKEYENDEMSVMLEFTPSWWRFSDFTIDPIKYIESVE